MVPARAASQPTSGQPAISALATKQAARWLCSRVMSSQETWLATNSTGSGSGVPRRRARKPKMRSSPVDHQRTRRWLNGSCVAVAARAGSSATTSASGMATITCKSSSGTRTA
uniref:Uncharacterized protein n=1 Tax=Mizugakiibacter sediminis TaxID=1475481 RepID=A0A0U1PA55_9GAMM